MATEQTKVIIDSFTPIQGPYGTVITAKIKDQGIRVDPTDATTIVGNLSNSQGGESVDSCDAAVVDSVTYTEFSITIPTDIEKGHLYFFSIDFIIIPQFGDSSEYCLQSTSPFLITLE
ncbi:hypothetical protein [Flavobacterium sp. UGB4466]|uniref:hypothetical protein n=1 Tax=Flavobacterium sp. UGB4466 TaxID=2730889 RepID=UPI00192BE416|nr:hypothetical protein [Flavobacterium sp. UGB4466]